MTLQNLRYVVEVANSKSFSRAAQSLFMTQSALSSSAETAARKAAPSFSDFPLPRLREGSRGGKDGDENFPKCRQKR